MRAAAEIAPAFRRFWDEGVKDRLPRAGAWIEREARPSALDSPPPSETATDLAGRHPQARRLSPGCHT
jgi:hypothetical protein